LPGTPLKHFHEDIARARALVAHADVLAACKESDLMLHSDLLRSAWMFAVGAMDAYFCDAYTDIIAATIISKRRHEGAELPDFFYDIRFPVRAILESYNKNENWKWRMAARKMMERENVLSLETVQRLFNRFLKHKLFHSQMERWIMHSAAKKRLFGTTAIAFNGLEGKARKQAIQNAKTQFQNRYRELFQRRHDCIHNCDRPRRAPQPLPLSGTALKVIEDAEFLVYRCDEHINLEFRTFLLEIGCPDQIVRQAGY